MRDGGVATGFGAGTGETAGRGFATAWNRGLNNGAAAVAGKFFEGGF